MGDLCEVIPKAVLEKMQKILWVAQKQIQQFSQRKWSSKTCMTRSYADVEQILFMELLHTLQCGDVDWAEIQCNCALHDRPCPWRGADAVTGEIAGTTCVQMEFNG